MPLQNRVTPFGDIIATPARGLFMGNRGIIHDPATRTLLRRRWTMRRWIVCVCAWKEVRRDVMRRQSWTELFFLDEATAFAAGHRPCFFCRRGDANAFRAAWSAGNRVRAPGADDMDDVLHRERLDGRAKRLHALPAPIAKLPTGTMVAVGDACYLLVKGRGVRWSETGYGEGPASWKGAKLVTPPSTVRALGAGYRVTVHPTAIGL